jgi:transposase InsO family protein
LQRRYPDQFADGQLRTLQRRVKVWRALRGPAKEVYFEHVYRPGQRCQSDFTSMNTLAITIQGQAFEHLLYHFTAGYGGILPYSNWETGSICFSESFEALSEGLQNALFTLGGVPKMHQTDALSAAVKQDQVGFTQRYGALLRHYGLEGRHTQPRHPNENGDITAGHGGEQRHHRFKRAVEQSLLLRGHRDFESRADYAQLPP